MLISYVRSSSVKVLHSSIYLEHIPPVVHVGLMIHAACKYIHFFLSIHFVSEVSGKFYEHEYLLCKSYSKSCDMSVLFHFWYFKADE